jgi:hypothetical protein
MSIRKKVVLLTLRLPCWGATKQDKRAARELADLHNAKHDAGKYKKQLIAQEYLKDLQSLAGEIRGDQYKITLPWRGQQKALPIVKLQEYLTSYRAKRQSYLDLVEKFCRIYPDLIAERRADLNTLFNPEDYPLPSEIREKFGCELSMEPIPKAEDFADFRADLSQEEVDELKAELEANQNAGAAEAAGALWSRLYNVVNSIAEALEREGKFHKTLFENCQALCEVLPKLNFTDDWKLEQLRREVQSKIANLDPDSLRNNKAERLQAGTEARELADALVKQGPKQVAEAEAKAAKAKAKAEAKAAKAKAAKAAKESAMAGFCGAPTIPLVPRTPTEAAEVVATEAERNGQADRFQL